MDWRVIERDVDGIVGAAFGEQVRLAFKKDGKNDPDRADATVRAILYVGADSSRLVGAGFGTRHAAGSGELVLDRSVYDGPLPRGGDKVRAVDRAGQPWFEVAHVADRHSNLLIVSLTEA